MVFKGCESTTKKNGKELMRCPCQTASYCCKEHQKLAYPGHKKECKRLRKEMSLLLYLTTINTFTFFLFFFFCDVNTLLTASSITSYNPPPYKCNSSTTPAPINICFVISLQRAKYTGYPSFPYNCIGIFNTSHAVTSIQPQLPKSITHPFHCLVLFIAIFELQ